MLDVTKLGHVDDDGESGGFAETRNAQEDIEARLESGVALEVDTERGIDRGNRTLDLAQTVGGLAFEQGGPACV